MDTGIIFIKNKKIDVLLAISADEQQTGLMYREPPVPNMAFIYGSPRINKFWMKDTKAALDIIFCCNNKVISICNGEPFSTRVIGGNDPSNLIIELPAGKAAELNINIGDEVKLECNSSALMNLLFEKVASVND